jgi:hypothetical protein
MVGHVPTYLSVADTPKQCSTKKMASELATSSSSIAAVGETAARLAIEPRSPHGRHGERGQLLRASGFAPCWEVFTWMVTVREGAHQCGRAVGTDDSIRVVRHRKDTNKPCSG